MKHIFASLIILLGLMSSCNYRTSSQKRFSKVLDVEIPKDVEVIKDEYQDMWQDFAIVYEIKLSKPQMTEFINSIRQSKYYNQNVFIEDCVSDEIFIESNNTRAVWAKTKVGFEFQTEYSRDVYTAEFNTTTRVAKFNESHD